jgi:hypothetical protein
VKLAGGPVPKEDKKSASATEESITEQTTSAIDQAKVLFAEMDNCESHSWSVRHTEALLTSH